MYGITILAIKKEQMGEYGISFGMWSKKNQLLFCALLLVAFPVVHLFKSTPHIHYQLSSSLISAQILAVSIPEELFFRSLIQTELKRHIKNQLLLFTVVSLMFTGAHLTRGINTFSLLTFFPSMVFCYARERFKSTLPAVLLHFTYNVLFFTL